nr:hypothetical protein [Candidatus Njordarchaeota archaeon]
MTKDWQPSDDVENTIIGMLLIAQRPLRFQTLWAWCQGLISKASFVKALNDLVKKDYVVRDRKSRKHVEFQLKLESLDAKPESFPSKDRIREVGGLYAWYTRQTNATTRVLLGISEISGKALKRRLIKAFLWAQASLFASIAMMLIFRDAEIEVTHEGTRFDHKLYSQMIPVLREVVKRRIVEIIEVDRQLASESLEYWLRSQSRLCKIPGKKP